MADVVCGDHSLLFVANVVVCLWWWSHPIHPTLMSQMMLQNTSFSINPVLSIGDGYAPVMYTRWDRPLVTFNWLRYAQKIDWTKKFQLTTRKWKKEKAKILVGNAVIMEYTAHTSHTTLLTLRNGKCIQENIHWTDKKVKFVEDERELVCVCVCAQESLSKLASHFAS